jgi:hypothetical protein
MIDKTVCKSRKRTGPTKVRAKRKHRSRTLTAEDMSRLDNQFFQIMVGFVALRHAIILLDRLSRGLAIEIEQDMMEVAEASYPLGC